MKITIEIAGDVSLNDATALMNKLQTEVLQQEVYKPLIKEVRVDQ